VFAANIGAEKPVKLSMGKAVWSQEKGENIVRIPLFIQIYKGWKLYAPPQKQDTLRYPPLLNREKIKNKPLSQNVLGASNIAHITLELPPGKSHEEKTSQGLLKSTVYTEGVAAIIRLKLNAPQATSATVPFEGLTCFKTCLPLSDELFIDIPEEIFTQKPLHSTQKSSWPSLPYGVQMLFWGLLGGIILNFMPCVLPVLGIKLQSMVQSTPALFRQMCLSTILGIFISFWILALITITLKHIFQYEAGWGLPLQNPYSVSFLCLMMIFFAFSFWGLFQFKTPQWVYRIVPQQGRKTQTAFFSGIFSALLATPCSAPMLGPAVGFALQGSIFDILMMFTAIPLGFSFPYWIGLLRPSIVTFLPKPGKWSLYLEYALGGLFLITALWLMFVLSHYLDFFSFLVSGACLFLLIASGGIATYFHNHFLISKIAVLIFICSGLSFMSLPFISEQKQIKEVSQKDGQIVWEVFSEPAINKALSEGKIVVIDITAAWCANCYVNKARVFMDHQIQQALVQKDIVCFRGDVTKYQEAQPLWKFMKRYKRQAVPFNMMLSKYHAIGVVLSEMLSTHEMMKTLRFLRKKAPPAVHPKKESAPTEKKALPPVKKVNAVPR
jgi:thiol:disulfide interchange protein